jgi:pimeloyl-ACP methyl ester carboxylesterase
MRPRRDELIAPEVHHTSAGDEYHVFYPRGKALRTVILIYGMAIQGEYDGRLLKFARSCTEAGLKVVIPHLPGLMEFCVAAGDMSRLENILITLGPTEKGRIGLIGFSTGGSYALLLAANTALRDKIAPVVLFSPIYDARDVAERLHAPVDPEPQTSKDWDEFYWGQFVIAFRNRKLLGIPKGVEKTLHTYMIDFVEFNLETKKTFYDRHIAPLQLTGRTDLLNEGQALDLLSARGKLSAVHSPVFILHDASDRVVPPNHSHRMYAELSQRGAGFQQEVLVTHWLSHVEMQKTGSITELFKIISFVSELFRNSPAG